MTSAKCLLGTWTSNPNCFVLIFFLLLALLLTNCQADFPFLVANEPLPTLVPTLGTLPHPPTPELPPTEILTTATPPATHTAVSPTLAPTNTATATQTPTPSYQLMLDAAQPQGYLSQFRLVTFYGSPTGPGLGILGELPREQMHQRLLETVADYDPFSDRPILPTYHLVTTVANPHPPLYYHRVNLDSIEQWVAEAKALETAVILDIQPGRGSIMAEFERLEHLLYEPHVHFAIDPEFVMNSWQVPLINVGQLPAAEINAIQTRMNAIGAEIGLNRVLILHQFKSSMLPDKALIEDFPYVEIVIDGDGVGPAAAKIRNYTNYATEPAFEYGGFKLFPTDGDFPVLTPAEVMNLQPQPMLIIYQ